MALITKQELQSRVDVANSVDNNKITRFIDQAEQIDLQPLVGERFLIAISQTPANYELLLNGGTYEYNGATYKHLGLKTVISHFFNARYKMFGSEVDTPFGGVVKNLQGTEQLSRARKKEIWTQSRQDALEYWSYVRDYLNRKSSEFPLWNIEPTRSRRGFRFERIG